MGNHRTIEMVGRTNLSLKNHLKTLVMSLVEVVEMVRLPTAEEAAGGACLIDRRVGAAEVQGK